MGAGIEKISLNLKVQNTLRFQNLWEKPVDITWGGGTPQGDPPGDPPGGPGGPFQDHLIPKLGGQRGESRRHTHSLLTPVGSADIYIYIY